MKIVSRTPEALVLRSGGAVARVVGALFILFAGPFLVFSMMSHRLVCEQDAAGGRACVLYPRVLGVDLAPKMLGAVTSARVAESSDGETYRVEFERESGQPVPLTSFWTSGYDGMEAKAEAITAFLRGGGRELEFGGPEGSWTLLLLGGVVVVGLLAMLLTSTVTARFDARDATVVITRRNVLGTRVERFGFSEVHEARLSERTDSEGDSTWRVELDLEKRSVHLSGAGNDLQAKQRAVEAINELLSRDRVNRFVA